MSKRVIPLYLALLPVIALIILLVVNIAVFGDDSVSGSSQVVLIFSGALAAGLAMMNGLRWRDLEAGIGKSIRTAIPAILILLLVGSLSGTWLVSGIIPAMIYYGLHLLNAEFFLPAACIICVFVSLFTGSSWTTAATVGIALIGIGKVFGLHPGMVAGAIISGSYFGDKMSPLSDTTNLASAATGTELFTHIRYMVLTTFPTITLSLILFLFLSIWAAPQEGDAGVDGMIQAISSSVDVSLWLLLVPALVLFMIIKKIPALPALFTGTFLGAVFAFIFQPDLVVAQAASESLNAEAYYRGIMQVLFAESHIQTGDAALDELLSAGGMSGMLFTIWLILSAMIFGGVMEASGFLHVITQTMLKGVKSVSGLVSATAGSCIFFNVTTSDQYLSVLLPGRMYGQSFEQYKLASQHLSRTIEDSGTVTSVLVPWNTCGAYHAGVLGVATLSYLPFAFFCLLSPIMTLLFTYFGFKIARLESEKE